MNASGRKHPTLTNFPVREILSDPDRFQSRSEYPRDVLESDFSDVEFSPLFAGMLSVWREPDSQAVYVVDGHKRLELARRANVSTVLVQFLDFEIASEAFAKGVVLNIAQWVFDSEDKVVWSCASRRAAVERALHTGWLDPDSDAARELYRYYPDFRRRYSSRSDWRTVVITGVVSHMTIEMCSACGIVNLEMSGLSWRLVRCVNKKARQKAGSPPRLPAPRLARV